MRKQIQQTEVLDTASASLRNAMYHVMPGVVQTYYPALQQADIKPATHDVRVDPTTGARTSEPWSVLPKIPVLFFRVGGFVLYADLKQGDKVILLAFDLDPSAFRKSGTAGDPVDTRRHGGSYWVALPADITDGGQLQAANGLLIVGSPGDFAALAGKVDQAVSTIVSSFNTAVGIFNAHVHPVTTAPGTTGPTATPETTISPAPASTASSKLKIPT